MGEEGEAPREEQTPPLCGLCWDWIWPGQAMDYLGAELIHRSCYRLSEAY